MQHQQLSPRAPALSSARDERFYTPRPYSQGSNGSGSDDWQTPRLSDGEFLTPRDGALSDRSTNAAASASSYGRVHNSSGWPPSIGAAMTHVPVREQTASRYGDDGYVGRVAIDMVRPTADQIESLFSCARHDRREEIEQALDRGVPVDVRDSFGNTILITACQNNNKRMAKLALRREADINVQNLKGNTPLHYCFHYGYGDVLGEYLISKGANPRIRNNAGKLCWEGI